MPKKKPCSTTGHHSLPPIPGSMYDKLALGHTRHFTASSSCPCCHSVATFSLPGLSAQQSSWLQRIQRHAFSAYPGLPALRQLHPLLGLHLLHAIQCWLLHINRRLGSWTSSTIPSPPLLSASGVLCIWNTPKTTQLLPCPPHQLWIYVLHHHGYYHLLHCDPHLTAISSVAVLQSTPCTHCGKPRPLLATVLLSPATKPEDAFTSERFTCCWWTPPSEPLTTTHAASSTTSFAGHLFPAVLPLSLLRKRTCSPPLLPPTNPAQAASLSAAYSSPPLSSRLRDSTPPPPFRVLSVNCGGLGCMLAQLFALLLYAEADIVCLQEVGPVPHDAFAGFPYKAWWGPPMVNGGVAALLHVRYGVGTTRAILQPHYVVISHPVTPSFTLSFASVHLAPSLPTLQRSTCCAGIASALSAAPRGLRLICGDLNDSITPGRSAWLHQAVAPSGLWAGFQTPYPPGSPTNFVHTTTGLSSREIDWVLVSSDSACAFGERTLLPGLCTHLALQCDLHLTAVGCPPADPSGRRFRFNLAHPQQLHCAGTICGLLLWWAAAAQLPIDAPRHQRR